MTKIDLELLRSDGVRKLDKVLGALIREGVTSASPEVEDRLAELARQHPDGEVRRQAVFLLGMRLRTPRAFQLLLDLASGADSDEIVVSTAINSLGAIGVEHPGLRARSTGAQARIALDSSRSDEDRGVAYKAARWATGLASALELAQAPEDISRMKPDLAWLRALVLLESGREQPSGA